MQDNNNDDISPKSSSQEPVAESSLSSESSKKYSTKDRIKKFLKTANPKDTPENDSGQKSGNAHVQALEEGERKFKKTYKAYTDLYKNEDVRKLFAAAWKEMTGLDKGVSGTLLDKLKSKFGLDEDYNPSDPKHNLGGGAAQKERDALKLSGKEAKAEDDSIAMTDRESLSSGWSDNDSGEMPDDSNDDVEEAGIEMTALNSSSSDDKRNGKEMTVNLEPVSGTGRVSPTKALAMTPEIEETKEKELEESAKQQNIP